MGCSSSSSTNKDAGGGGGGPEDGKSRSQADRAKQGKSLSNYNKTKGGSMLINVSQASQHEWNDSADFLDDQHIMSPREPDWKVGKTVKRAPDMKETAVVNVPSESTDEVVKIQLAYKTLQGRNPRPPHKPNQDALSIFRVHDNPNLAVFAVFDGHGPFGEHASHFMRSRLHPAMAQRAELCKTDPKKALIEALDEIHQSFCSDATLKVGVDPVVSGTTCILIMFDGKQVHVANVGDSRAIIGTYNETTKKIDTAPLSDDHKPQRADEKARLEKSGALLLTEREVRGFGDDSKIYICREKGGDIVYGVLFTRSLGDLDAHNHLGVSAEPEMGLRVLSPDDRYFILASDGVWDYMTNEEVMELCVNNSDPLKAASAIVDVASDRWEQRDADHRRDDITVMILRTEIEKASKAAAPDASGAASNNGGDGDQVPVAAAAPPEASSS